MALQNLAAFVPPAGDISFKSVLEFFDAWKEVVTLHRFNYDADTDKLEVAYVHVTGCGARELKNANTLLKCYLNTLTDIGLCSQVRVRVWG